MSVSARTYLTSGIAVLGAGAIALTPVQPLPDHMAAAPQRAVESLAVNLAATIDPITPWVDTFKLAADNIKQLGAFYAQKPFPLLQTVGANIGTYFGELTNGNAGLIPGQIQNNINTFFYSPWWNAPGQKIPATSGVTIKDFANAYISKTFVASGLGGALKLSQSSIYSLLPGQLTPEQLASLGPVLQFTATPYSGQLAGLVSPFIGSLVQLTRSFTAVGQLFQAGDALGAINELINIPANTTNAFLNGAGNLDLTSIAGSLLPSSVKKIGLNLGGWISPPVPFNGSLIKPLETPTELTGGTFFDSVSATAQAFGIEVTTPGLPESGVGSVIGLGQFLGKQLVVTPPPPAPKAAAATPADPAIPAIPAIPATPAVPATPAAGTPAAGADTPATSHRGGNSGSDNGGHSGGRGHRGAA